MADNRVTRANVRSRRTCSRSYADDGCVDRASCCFFVIYSKWKDAAQAPIMSLECKKSTATSNMLEECNMVSHSNKFA